MRHIDVSGVAIMSAVLRAQDGFDGGRVRAIFFFNIWLGAGMCVMMCAMLTAVWCVIMFAMVFGIFCAILHAWCLAFYSMSWCAQLLYAILREFICVVLRSIVSTRFLYIVCDIVCPDLCDGPHEKVHVAREFLTLLHASILRCWTQ